jgi:hypothetical protein
MMVLTPALAYVWVVRLSVVPSPQFTDEIVPTEPKVFSVTFHASIPVPAEAEKVAKGELPLCTPEPSPRSS